MHFCLDATFQFDHPLSEWTKSNGWGGDCNMLKDFIVGDLCHEMESVETMSSFHPTIPPPPTQPPPPESS